MHKFGVSTPHTTHCLADGDVMISTLGKQLTLIENHLVNKLPKEHFVWKYEQKVKNIYVIKFFANIYIFIYVSISWLNSWSKLADIFREPIFTPVVIKAKQI